MTSRSLGRETPTVSSAPVQPSRRRFVTGLLLSQVSVFLTACSRGVVTSPPSLLKPTMTTNPLTDAGAPIDPIVQTTAGQVRGLSLTGIQVFKGVPYGAPTGGKNRFRAAKPAPAWQAIRDCKEYGPTAPQGQYHFGSIDTAKTAQADPIRASLAQALMGVSGKPHPASEDCLVLNVFTPATDRTKRPVMVWLHGGGFAIGSASTDLYDGRALARHGDVVVVSLNHRLSALGFLYLGDLDPAYADSANAGMQDIVLALKWVRDNIAAFGGDPDNVTLFGESGGGQKVGMLMAIPSAAGLFHKAIVQSGPADRVVPRADAALLARRLLEKLNIAENELQKLQDLDVDVILQAAGDVQFPAFNLSSALAPVVDGNILPTQPFSPVAPDVSHKVPLLIGTNKDEFIPFLSGIPNLLQLSHDQARDQAAQMIAGYGANLYDMYHAMIPDEQPLYLLCDLLTDLRFWSGSVRIAERKVIQATAPVYMYRLTWEAPGFGGFLRTPHGLDLPLVFGNLEMARVLIGTGPVPEKLSSAMMSAWIAFARHGNPSTPTLKWPRYDLAQRTTMEFNAVCAAEKDPLQARRVFWEQHA